jgi:hypothetical protein
MPTGGGWVVAAVAVGVVFCAAMWGWHSLRGRRTDDELDAIERRLNSIGQRLREAEKRFEPYDVEAVDVDEVELRAHMDYDAYRFGYRLPGEVQR